MNSSQGRSGQAVVEYIMMLLVALTIASALAISFKRMREKFLMQVVCEVSAPCPKCAPPEDVRSAAQSRAPEACQIR